MSKPSPKRALIGASVVVLALISLYSIRWRSAAPSEEALFQGAPASSHHSPQTTMHPKEPKREEHRPSSVPDEQDETASEGDGTPREVAEKRLERARHTLQGYLIGTRYPPESRPLSEMRELSKPHAVQPSKQPLSRPDQKRTDARVNLSQDRLYLVGDETAALSISCETSGRPAPCEVLSALAMVPETMPEAASLSGQPVRFSDGGTEGDMTAGDGTMTALFTPEKEGFGGYYGPIYVELGLRVAGEEGTARFDLGYTPSPPARFTGEVREAMENGSVCLYLGMDVSKPGRYLLAGRVDDAEGVSFAYLEHNDLLPKGQTEAKMCIFGKLILDERAESPFVLRDVEGFLLKEDTYPDRELCAAKEGPYYKTKRYEESAFSDEDWQSEEKARHVEEFTKDVKEAEDALSDAQ